MGTQKWCYKSQNHYMHITKKRYNLSNWANPERIVFYILITDRINLVNGFYILQFTIAIT